MLNAGGLDVASAIAHRGDVHLLALWTGARCGANWAQGHWWGGIAADLEFILLLMYWATSRWSPDHRRPRRAAKAGAVLALVGAVNMPIIYFSVRLVEHAAPGRIDQPDQAAPSMAKTMLIGMLIMTFAFWDVLRGRRRSGAGARHHPRAGGDTDWVRWVATGLESGTWGSHDHDRSSLVAGRISSAMGGYWISIGARTPSRC